MSHFLNAPSVRKKSNLKGYILSHSPNSLIPATQTVHPYFVEHSGYDFARITIASSDIRDPSFSQNKAY